MAQSRLRLCRLVAALAVAERVSPCAAQGGALSASGASSAAEGTRVSNDNVTALDDLAAVLFPRGLNERRLLDEPEAQCPDVRRTAFSRQWALTVVVASAKHLPYADARHSDVPDAYVEATVGRGDGDGDEYFEFMSSYVIKNTFDPVWDFSCTMFAPRTLASVQVYGSVKDWDRRNSRGDVELGTFNINVPLTEHGFEQRVRLHCDLCSASRPAYLVVTVSAIMLYGTWIPAAACILLLLVCLGVLGVAYRKKALLPSIGGVDQQAASHPTGIPQQQVESQACQDFGLAPPHDVRTSHLNGAGKPQDFGLAPPQDLRTSHVDGAGNPQDFGLAPPQDLQTSHVDGAGKPQDFGLAPPQDVRTSHANFGWGGGGGAYGGAGGGGGGATWGGCGGGWGAGATTASAGAPLLHSTYYDSSSHFASPHPVVVSVELTATTASSTPMPAEVSVDCRPGTPLTPQPLWPKS